MKLEEFLASRRYVADLREETENPFSENPEPVAGYIYADSYVIGDYGATIEGVSGARGRYHLFLQYDELRDDLRSCELDLFYHYGRHCTPETELSGFDLFSMAAQQSDLNSAVYYVQNLLGVASGDRASLFFSDVNALGRGKEWDALWPELTPDERLRALADYARGETIAEVSAMLEGN